MSRSTIPLSILGIWYDFLLYLRLKIGIWHFARLTNRSLRRLVVWLPLLLIIGLLSFQGFNIFALVKLMIALATYIVIVSCVRVLIGNKWAQMTAWVFVSLVIAVTALKPVGQYDEIVPRARFVDKPQTFWTQIYTFPQSPRWEKIKAADAKPFLFISSPTSFTDDMAVAKINDVVLGPVQNIPGASFGSGAWVVPIQWDQIIGREIVDIQLFLKPGADGGYWFAAASDIPISGRKASQRFKIGNGPWQDVETVMGQPQMMTVEIRFADWQGRNIGILY